MANATAGSCYEDLATAAGIRRGTLVRIEKGDRSTQIRNPGGAGPGRSGGRRRG
ncbi:MAG: hypothetical protein Q7O66_04960 [Dehalococcoidia bacterium]|nr:hypothetical protein [Dehalococcoidia bacterium]